MSEDIITVPSEDHIEDQVSQKDHENIPSRRELYKN